MVFLVTLRMMKILLFTNAFIHFDVLNCIKHLRVSGVCHSAGDAVRCCTDYRQDGGICIPCIGSFGINCTGGVCVEGFYGFGCRGICNCSKDEICDRRLGCETKTLEKDTTAAGTSSTVVIILLSGVILFLIFLLLGMGIRSKILLSRQGVHENYRREDANTTNTESHSNGTEEYQSYNECYPISMTGTDPDNDFAHSSYADQISGHYIAVNTTHPPREGVLTSIQQAFEENRKRNGILLLLSKRKPLSRNTSLGCSYLSVLESHQNCVNGDES